MKKIALYTILLFAQIGICEAKEKPEIKVTPVTEDADAANNGIIYSLPKTVVHITVEAEATIEKAGPYYNYSNRYLNLTNVIKEDRITYRIVSATITAKGVPDNRRRYKISASNVSLPAVALTQENVLCGINIPAVRPPQPPTGDFKPQPPMPKKDVGQLSFDDVKLERAILTRTSTATMAEEAAQAIYRLRERRLSLLGGEDATVLNDEGSYKHVLAQIDELEKEHVALFAGKRETVRLTKEFEFVPDISGTNSSVLFRFSETSGFLDAMDLSGKPVYLDISFGKDHRLNELAADSKQRKSAPLQGLRYIIPGSLNIKLIDRNILLVEKNILCSQNGQIATLPVSLLLEQNRPIEFDTTNGALKGIGNIQNK